MNHLKNAKSSAAQQQSKNNVKFANQNSQSLNYHYDEKNYAIKSEKRITFLFSFVFILFSIQLYAQPHAQLELGTPESVLNAVIAQHSRSSAKLTFQLSANLTVDIHVLEFFNQNDKISIHGIVKESNNSSFILKGNRSSLYGYYVLHDSKKAYEITTTNGVVSIEEIDIAKIYPDRYETQMKPPIQNAPLAAVLPVYSPMAQRQVIHIGPYNNEDITKLQSKPGSPYVFYLNMTAVLNGDTSKNGNTKEAVYRVWQSVSDQYSMFNLNITTDPAIYEAAKNADVSKTGIIDFIDAVG